MKNIFGKSLNRAIHTAVVAVMVFTLATTSVTERAFADSQAQGQATTEKYARNLTTARPYPLGQMNDSTERAQLSERLQRMNDPNKLGYVTLLSANGQIIATFTIKGKVSSTGSQLTNTQNVQVKYSTATVVDSMGDDGSYGPEEGGKNGIFFFTTKGVLVEWNGVWQYSDAPVHLTTPPLVVLPADATPSTNEGHLAGK